VFEFAPFRDAHGVLARLRAAGGSLTAADVSRRIDIEANKRLFGQRRLRGLRRRVGRLLGQQVARQLLRGHATGQHLRLETVDVQISSDRGDLRLGAKVVDVRQRAGLGNAPRHAQNGRPQAAQRIADVERLALLLLDFHSRGEGNPLREAFAARHAGHLTDAQRVTLRSFESWRTWLLGAGGPTLERLRMGFSPTGRYPAEAFAYAPAWRAFDRVFETLHHADPELCRDLLAHVLGAPASSRWSLEQLEVALR
jgi:hypothetical protein